MTPLEPGTSGFIERLLADRIGLDIASVGEGVIVRGVDIRMRQLGIRRREDYERILLGPTDEVQALIEEVVIPESWFFRDDRPFATFREFVRTGWVADPQRSPISILCLPCAGGEEPYSVVISLLELGMTRERFDVVAVDVSERSIHRATAGIYGANAFRGVDLKLQTLYFDFTAIPGRYQIKASVRSAVRFKQGNLLDPTLLKERRGFDVVFCRNLLIYLDDSARIKAFNNLDRLTHEEGFLFLGHADRPESNTLARFIPVGEKGSFAYRKRIADSSPAGTASPPPSPAHGKSSRPATPSKPQSFDTQSSRIIDPVRHPAVGRLQVPSRQIEPLRLDPRLTPVPTSGAVSPLVVPQADRDEVFNQASVLADQGRYAEATRLVLDLMGRTTLDASTHFLLGIIHQAAGERVSAEAELTKAIYLDPGHDEALLALALLARRKGDMAAEATYRRRADRVLARKGR